MESQCGTKPVALCGCGCCLVFVFVFIFVIVFVFIVVSAIELFVCVVVSLRFISSGGSGSVHGSDDAGCCFCLLLLLLFIIVIVIVQSRQCAFITLFLVIALSKLVPLVPFIVVASVHARHSAWPGSGSDVATRVALQIVSTAAATTTDSIAFARHAAFGTCVIAVAASDFVHLHTAVFSARCGSVVIVIHHSAIWLLQQLCLQQPQSIVKCGFDF